MRALRPTSVCVALLAIAALAMPGQALAVAPAVADCAHHNALTRHYSISELQNALATIPADLKEYGPCYQVIQQQLDKQLSGVKATDSGSGSGGGGSGIVILIIVVVVIALGGGGAAYAAHRRGGGDSPPPPAE